MLAGSILTLDLSNLTGFAKGAAGEKPRSGTVKLRRDGERREVALGNLIAFLDQEFMTDRPAKVFKEQMLPLQAFVRMKNGENSVALQRSMHGIVEGMCNRYGIEWEDVAASTARKHFIGRGNMGSRDKTKSAVVARCHVLELMPIDCVDDNRGDALAIWDWATATYCRRIPAELHLFGEIAHG